MKKTLWYGYISPKTGAGRMTFGGALFGMLFPLLGTLVECARLNRLTLPGVLSVQAQTPLLWIIDATPLILGIAGWFIAMPRFSVRLSGRQRVLTYLMTGLTLIPIVILMTAIRESAIATIQFTDVNRSGSLRYHSLHLYAVTKNTVTDGDWQTELAAMRVIRVGLRVRYPGPVADTDDAWEPFAASLTRTGRVDWGTTERLRLSANVLTNAIEAEARAEASRASALMTLGILGLIVSLLGTAILLRSLALSAQEQTQAHAEIVESRDLFLSSVTALHDGFLIQDPTGTILQCNPRSEIILGLSADQIIGRTSLDPRWRSVHEDHSDFPGQDHPAMISLREGASQTAVIMGVHKPTGELTWISINTVPLFRPNATAPYAVVSTFQDITERKAAETKIKDYTVVLEFQKEELEKANTYLGQLAATDGLTGLKNHRNFQERLIEEESRAARYGTSLSAVLLDVDKFKQYNDTFGHPAGDEVLRRIARLLTECARVTDLVARYGGEEFVLLLPQTDAAGACVIAERIRAAVESYAWTRREVTVSLGVASLGLETDSPSLLVARADEALYRAKEAGRNRVVCGPGLPVGQPPGDLIVHHP